MRPRSRAGELSKWPSEITSVRLSLARSHTLPVSQLIDRFCSLGYGAVAHFHDDRIVLQPILPPVDLQPRIRKAILASSLRPTLRFRRNVSRMEAAARKRTSR